MLVAGAAAAAAVANRAAHLANDAEAGTLRKIDRLEQQLLETQRHGDLMEESRLCNNIAKAYEKLGEWAKALQFHHYDRQISVTVGDTEGFLLAVGNMAQVFLS